MNEEIISRKEPAKRMENEIFSNDSNKFTAQLRDKPLQNITLELSKHFETEQEKYDPTEEVFKNFPEYTDGMNMNFSEDTRVLFGKYINDSVNPIFVQTNPKEAEQVFICEKTWNYDPFRENSPETDSALYSSFSHTTAGRKRITNYLIYDVGHVFGEPDRDVSQFLDEMSQRIIQEELLKRAIEKNCPSNFEYRNIIDENEVYSPEVFDENGESMYPDNANGDSEIWYQIYENDIVVALSKATNNDSLVFHPEWMPSEITDAQKNAVINFVSTTMHDCNLDLVSEKGVHIKPEETIQLCEEKLTKQEMFKEFKNIEAQLEALTPDAPGLDAEQLHAINTLGKRYVELADTYRFDSRFDIDKDTNELYRTKKELNLTEAQKAEHVRLQYIKDRGTYMFSPYDTNSVTKPRMYIEFSKAFTVENFHDNFVSDYYFRDFKEYTDGMNMQFNGEPSVLFGKFRYGDRFPVFTITDPREATQVFIDVSWGRHIDHDGSHYTGQTYNSKEAESALYFSQNEIFEHGGWGEDYYVLNVGHVLGQPDRDVSHFLEEMYDVIRNEQKEYRLMRESAEAKLEYFQDTITDKLYDLQEFIEESPLPKDSGLARQLLQAQPIDDYLFVENLSIDQRIPFDEEGLQRIERLSERIHDASKNYEKNLDKLREYEQLLSQYGIKITNDSAPIFNIAGYNYKIDYDCGIDTRFDLSDQGMYWLEKSVNTIMEAEKQRENQEYQNEFTMNSKSNGYASFFRDDDILMSVEFVIDENGNRRSSIPDPTYEQLDYTVRQFEDEYFNHNDVMSRFEFYKEKDHIRYWDTFQENDIVISLKQDHFGEKMKFDIESAPNNLTDAQKESILSITNKYLYDRDTQELFYKDSMTHDEPVFLNQENLIQICEEQIEYDAFRKFRKLERRIEELTANESLPLLDELERKELYDSSIKYMELAEQHGFETKYDFTLEEPTKDIIDQHNVGKKDDYDPGSDR